MVKGESSHYALCTMYESVKEDTYCPATLEIYKSGVNQRSIMFNVHKKAKAFYFKRAKRVRIIHENGCKKLFLG